MDVAIVTGAETPLGLNLCQRLLRQGYRVHGIGNNFSKVTFADPQFKAHAVDVTATADVVGALEHILAEEPSLDLLVHALDVTPGASFEKLPVGNLEAVLKIGLLGPVLLTRLALPNLLKFRGQLINIIPANKSGHPSSAVNALLEGALREMNRALFDDSRDKGLRLTNLILRQNPEPDGLSVKSGEQTRINLEDVARTVEQLIDPKLANIPAELTLFPRSSAEGGDALPETPAALDPYNQVILPPQAYCPPEEAKIPTREKETVHRTIPYTDDEMEDKIAAAIEDFEAHPERYETPRPAEREPSAEASTPPEGGSGKRRRGRRRGGRNRGRKSGGKDQPPAQNDSVHDGGTPKSAAPAETQSAGESPGPAGPAQADKGAGQSRKGSAKSGKGPRGSARGSGKPPQSGAQQADQSSRASGAEASPAETGKAATAHKDTSAGAKPEPKKATQKRAAKKSAKKAGAKKTARKAAKKAAKKAPKKAAAKKSKDSGSPPQAAD